MSTSPTIGEPIFANPFKREAAELLAEYLRACERVITSGMYVLGPEVQSFERELAEYLGAAHVIGCASGMDALILSLRAAGVGPGDEVITTPLSAAATALAVTHLGATPVFVDVLEDTLAIDPGLVQRAITPRTRCVIPVHLFGLPARSAELRALCDAAGIVLVEDCAQAIGARERDQIVGTFGQTGCFSFYPTKNLGAFGDAGAVCTNDADVAATLRKLRNYGQRARYDHELAGYNSRLDELHAAMLREKLRHLDRWTQRRREIAAHYDGVVDRIGRWRLPSARDGSTCVYHLYPVQVDRRDAVLEALKGMGIEILIHYPTLIPEQECYRGRYPAPDQAHPVALRASRRLLSLPINPYLTDVEVERVSVALELALA